MDGQQGLTDQKPPPPGSEEAQAIGCVCPRIDNARGKGYMGIEGVHVYRLDCPVHRPKEKA